MMAIFEFFDFDRDEFLSSSEIDTMIQALHGYWMDGEGDSPRSRLDTINSKKKMRTQSVDQSLLKAEKEKLLKPGMKKVSKDEFL